MKRRDFLRVSTSLAGVMLPPLVRGQSAPCPPRELGVSGGSSTTAACISSSDAEADWVARKSEAGVIWAHDFRSDAEVNNFLKTPNGLSAGIHDPRLMAHRTGADGITGDGCLELLNVGSSLSQAASSAATQLQLQDASDFPDVGSPEAAYEVTVQTSSPRMKEVVLVTGKKGNVLYVERGRKFPEPLKFENEGRPAAWSVGAAVGMDTDGGWARPLSAIVAGDNGLPEDDAAASGKLRKRSFSPSQGQSVSNLIYNFRTGYYGHHDYHKVYESWNGEDNIWDGDEFYLQFRVKIDPRRIDARNEGGGKLWFLHMMGKGGAQQLVMHSPDSTSARFSIFTNYGTNLNSRLSDPQGGIGSSLMPESPWADSCVTGKLQDCWEWPVGEWVTLLLHVKPGHDNDFQYPRGDEIRTGENLMLTDTTAFRPVNDGSVIEFETNAVPIKDTFRFEGAQDPQQAGYFNGWKLQFLSGGALPDDFRFQVVDYRSSNGRAHWKIRPYRNVDSLPNGVPLSGDGIKVYWAAVDENAKYKDTGLEIWAKRRNDAGYVPLFSKADLAWIFGDTSQGIYGLHPPGFNCFQPTGYQNVQDGVMPPRLTYWYRFDQIILSRNFINPPRD